ncbi:polycystic kidney disease protein 1-like 3 [Pseudoliparis swirei]|uniref:polycystic kidney disease protein 1-like 3 n=1 Tax=Pseudoliparis swirei TaxID=2059687 RepID=UPI0024BD830F|nr:polycystic kidney disease protein 1-like 3 [Pseudoliparis swirei]
MTSRSFRRLFPQLNVRSIPEDEFYLQACRSQLLTGPDKQELTFFRPDAKDPLELVEATPELAGMLGSSLEFVDTHWASPPPTPPPPTLPQSFHPLLPPEAGTKQSRFAESRLGQGFKTLGLSKMEPNMNAGMWEHPGNNITGVPLPAKPNMTESMWEVQRQQSKNTWILNSNSDSRERRQHGSESTNTSARSESTVGANMREPQQLRSGSLMTSFAKVEPRLIQRENPADSTSAVNANAWRRPNPNPHSTNSGGMPGRVSNSTNLGVTPKKVSDTTNPEGMPGRVSNSTNPEGMPGGVSDSTNPGGMPGRVSDSTSPGGMPGRVSDSTSPGGTPGRVSDSTNPGGTTGRVSDSTSPGGMPGRVSDSTNPGGMPGRVSDSTNPGGTPGGVSDSTNPGGTPGRVSDSTSPGGMPGWVSDSTSPGGTPGRVSDSTSPGGTPGWVSDSTNPGGMPGRVSDSTSPAGIPGGVSDSTSPAGTHGGVSDSTSPAGMPGGVSDSTSPAGTPGGVSDSKSPAGTPGGVSNSINRGASVDTRVWEQQQRLGSNISSEPAAMPEANVWERHGVKRVVGVDAYHGGKTIKMDAAWQRNLGNVRVHIRDLGLKVGGGTIRRDVKKESGKSVRVKSRS